MSDESALLGLQFEENRALREKFVRPICLRLLHANFARNPIDGSDALTKIADAARMISDEEISKLLRMREWRGRLIAGWCVGLSRRTSFVDEIAELLLASEMVYSGQGYCAALGLIGDAQCLTHLQDYLRKYLPPCGRIYDQLWAVGALAYVQGDLPVNFLAPELWNETNVRMDPLNGIESFRQIVNFLILHKMVPTDHEWAS